MSTNMADHVPETVALAVVIAVVRYVLGRLVTTKLPGLEEYGPANNPGCGTGLAGVFLFIGAVAGNHWWVMSFAFAGVGYALCRLDRR